MLPLQATSSSSVNFNFPPILKAKSQPLLKITLLAILTLLSAPFIAATKVMENQVVVQNDNSGAFALSPNNFAFINDEVTTVEDRKPLDPVIALRYRMSPAELKKIGIEFTDSDITKNFEKIVQKLTPIAAANTPIDIAALLETQIKDNEDPSKKVNTAKSWNALGERYLNGIHIPHHPQRAVDSFQNAADRKDPEGMTRLGQMYCDGAVGVEKDVVKGLKLLQEAAALNHPRAIYALAKMRFEGTNGFKKETEIAIEEIKKAADMNFAEAQYSLGLIFKNGDKVPQDIDLAIAWFNKAVHNKVDQALFPLAQLYQIKAVNTDDLNEKIKFLKEAADRLLQALNKKMLFENASSPATKDRLGIVYAAIGDFYIEQYEANPFEEEHLSHAQSFYQKGADQGHADAQYNLNIINSQW